MNLEKRIHALVMDRAVSILRADGNISGVTVVSQNEQDLSTLIQEEDGKLDGVVVVVSVDSVSKIASRPAKYAVTFSVNVTEFVPINRENPGFATAIDVAMECAEEIDRIGFGHFDTLRHSTPGDGILNAVAECRGEFTVHQGE